MRECLREANAAPRQPVDIRCVDLPVAKTAQHTVQVIDSNEKNVLLTPGCERWGCQAGKEFATIHVFLGP